MKPKSFIKIGLSALMLFLVSRSVNFSQLKVTFQSIPIGIVLIVIFGYAVGQLMSSLKWCLILRAGGIPVSYTTVLKAYFIGSFVNCFGFGMLGGDVTRALLVTQGLPRKAEGIASVVADRVHGLTVLCVIALVTSFSLGHPGVSAPFINGLFALAAGFIAAWLVGPWVLTRVPLFQRFKFAGKLAQVAAVFPKDLRTITAITAISVVFHTLQILLHAVMAIGVGASIPLSVLFVVIPIVNTAASLPISWQGVGVREKAYIHFLTPAGILSQEQAVAFGAMWLAAVTATSAIGGLIAIVSGDLKALKESSVDTNSASTKAEVVV